MNKHEQQLKQVLQIGAIYEHYKSTEQKKMLYKVTGIARHSETQQLVVIYTALYGSNGQWVRPLAMFLEDVKVNGHHVSRFKLVD